MSYVITCGDEGVQINEGTRLAFLGAGVKLAGFPEVIEVLKRVLNHSSAQKIVMAASEENDWIKQQFELNTWEQASATMQQQVQALADQVKLGYAGNLPFADPEELKYGIKGHMVRPKGVHIANKIVVTCGGGEQTYHLGHFLISGDWAAAANPDLIRQVMKPQVEFYTRLSKREQLPLEFELAGPLGEATAKLNQEAVQAALG